MLALVAFILMQPPLSGPRVNKDRDEGLVQYDVAGRVRRPEKPVEQLAAESLPLSPEDRWRVDSVIAERAAAIDGFVSKNLLFLSQVQTIQTAGSLRERVVFVFDGLRRLGEAIGGPSLRDRVQGALPPGEVPKYRALLKEYWKALEHEARTQKPADPPPPWAVYLGESLASLGREIERSFQRQVGAGALFADYLVADLNLTPQQKETLNGLKLDMLQRTGMKATERDQQMMILSAAAYLTQPQRERLMEKIAAIRGK